MKEGLIVPIPGDIYFVKAFSREYLVLCEDKANGILHLSITDKSWNESGWKFWTDSSTTEIRPATTFEKEWFNECKKARAFIHKDKPVAEVSALPKNWCVAVTKESVDSLNGWRLDKGLLNLGSGGYVVSADEVTGKRGYWYSNRPEAFTEITFAQFKKHILKEGTSELVTDISLPTKWFVRWKTPQDCEDTNMWGYKKKNHFSFVDGSVITYDNQYLSGMSLITQGETIFKLGLKEITMDQFRKHILKKTVESTSIGVIYQRPKDVYNEPWIDVVNKKNYYCSQSDLTPYFKPSTKEAFDNQLKPKMKEEEWCIIITPELKTDIISWGGTDKSWSGTSVYYGIHEGRKYADQRSWGRIVQKDEFYQKIGKLQKAIIDPYKLPVDQALNTGEYVRFLVGDWVVLMANSNMSSNRVGDVGQIVEEYKGEGRLWKVQVNNGPTNATYSYGTEIRKALPHEIPRQFKSDPIPKVLDRRAELLAEARRRFPIGTKFVSTVGDVETATVEPWFCRDNDIAVKPGGNGGVCYREADNQWGKVIESTPFSYTPAAPVYGTGFVELERKKDKLTHVNHEDGIVLPKTKKRTKIQVINF